MLSEIPPGLCVALARVRNGNSSFLRPQAGASLTSRPAIQIARGQLLAPACGGSSAEQRVMLQLDELIREGLLLFDICILQSSRAAHGAF